VLRWFLLALLRLYKLLLSPLLGQRCRFYPSCSTYAAEAITRHGAARGSYMAVCRVARCHPGCEGGNDPVPERFSWRPWRQEEKEQ
jgi:putative membrane protein insertion efficiency factor